MTASLAQLGARVVRKLGIAVVDASARPGAAGIVSQADIAAQALRAVGVNPAPLGSATATGITYTGAALATAALLKLAVIASDETPIASDAAEALARVSDVHDSLVGLVFVTWSVDTVPAAVADFYVIMAANLLAPQFGKPGSAEAYAQAQAGIRQQALSGAYGQTLAAAKVVEVHEALNIAGLVTWLVSAIPAGLAESYVQLTAALLAPVFGHPLDKAAWDAGIAVVRRIAIVAGAQALAEQKIRAVQASLEARGKARWTIHNVPVWAEEPLVLMAATLMAPECEMKADPHWMMGAELDLTRITALPSAYGHVVAVYF